MRAVVTDDYADRQGHKPFDLGAEKQRLRAWLDRGGKAQLLADPQAIARFHADADGGPLAKDKLRWRVHRITPSRRDPTRWEYSFSQSRPGLATATVALFDAASEYDGGSVPDAMRHLPPASQQLLELVAVNCDEVHFDASDLSDVRSGNGADGGAAIDYVLKDARCNAFAEWSEKYIRKHVAILYDDVVLSAPVFISRIPGSGQIAGDFSPEEAADMVAVLKTKPLPAVPVFVRQEPVPRPASGGR